MNYASFHQPLRTATLHTYPTADFTTNALLSKMLSCYLVLLNRTLLVPPFGSARSLIRYVQYDRLRQFLALSGQKKAYTIVPKSRRTHFLPDECFDYFNYTHIPWEWLVDLTKVKMDQTLLQVWNFTESWPADHLDIPQQDTLILRDTHTRINTVFSTLHRMPPLPMANSLRISTYPISQSHPHASFK